MLLQLLGDKEGIAAMPFHADVEGFEASAQDPGIEGGERGTGAAAEEIDLVDQLFSSQDGAAEDAALAIEPFSGGVYDEIRTEIHGCLTDGSREAIVHIEEDIVFAAERARGFRCGSHRTLRH